MTIVRMGRKGDDCMEFEFDNAMSAFTFYAQALDSYREDDMLIAMEEEKDDVQNA